MDYFDFLNDNRIFCAYKEDGSIWKENIKKEQIKNLNEKKYGISKSVNLFNGRRMKDDLLKIVSVYQETDDKPKIDQFKIIQKLNIEPSEIIESKRGFHVYYILKETENVKLEDYENLMKNY